MLIVRRAQQGTVMAALGVRGATRTKDVKYIKVSPMNQLMHPPMDVANSWLMCLPMDDVPSDG